MPLSIAGGLAPQAVSNRHKLSADNGGVMDRLFTGQRLNRIEPGSFTGRHKAEYDAGDQRTAKRTEHRHQGKLHRHFSQYQHAAHQQGQGNTEQATDHRKHHRFGEELAQDVGVALSVNLDNGLFVNQSAAFSDFHGTGANPAANAAYADAAFISNRFRVVTTRRHV